MARKKISELPLDNAVIGTDVVPIVSDGATKRVQLSTLGTYFASVGGYTLPTATASVLGGVKIGAGVTITDGVISVSTDYAATSHTHDTLTSGTDTLSLDGAGAITFTHSPGGGALEFPQSTGSLARIVAPSTQGLGIYSGNNAEPVYIYTVDNKSLGGVYVGTVEFPDKTTQTTAWLGSVDWASVNSKPSTFEPTAHKTSHATGGSDALTASDIGAAAASHAHGNITDAGAIGSTSGLVVTTGASGVLNALAQGTAGQVLKVNSGATGVEWGAAAADVTIDTTAADVLSATSGSISADDPGADRLVFWDDSASKLAYLSAGTNITITDTTISAAGSTSASDLTSGTLGVQRLPARVRASTNLYLWSAFR